MPASPTSSPNENWLNRPLAIVGMACRLPGAEDLEQFWDLLNSGGYAVRRMPDAKLDRELYFHPEKGNRGTTYSDVGGFVQEREWDWELLPVDPEAAQDWDECHLNLCEVAARACQHAGYDSRNLPHKNASVFVGHSGGSTLGGELAFRALSSDYSDLVTDVDGNLGTNVEELKEELLERLQDGRPSRENGKPLVEASYAAGIVSHALGLNGPFMSIDAACASSLVALALAANTLHSGTSDMAIVGGASYNKTDSLILFSNAQSCSASASRPFDENADGLISSEGYVCVVIKTLERAQADGDKVHAVINGIGVSSDGRGRSLWAPRKEGQFTAIERAYSGDVKPDSVQMIEAHATSTQVGDATEMEALANFYQAHLKNGRRLPVGSVKSNIGHTLETAGLAGLVKAVLSIQHETIPKTVNVEQLSSSIPWSDIPLYAATENEPWPSLSPGQPRRAAVNAFGIGGLNVHVVVDQYLGQQEAIPRVKTATRSVAKEPISVIGRGLIVPGAQNIASFGNLLDRPVSQLRYPPRDRVRTRGPNPVESGFITDYAYDWRKHKVPPKQISQANPLQFMLLDAAGQALEEAGLVDKDWDRQHAAVVVGSSFGGDFGNALFVGLRLPEVRAHLRCILRNRGVSDAEAAQWIDRYESIFLQAYPAVLDETGSFTSSTLASRLSKTFDLMGGAMAVDAGDASSFAAMNTACGLLRSGSVSHVLCAAAQRALDHAAIENLWQLGRLPGSSAQAGDGYSVGEGVALLLLKRESDALRDGDKIFATIDDVSVGFDRDSLASGFEHAANLQLGKEQISPTGLIGAVGHSELDSQVAKPLQKFSSSPFSRAKSQAATGHLQAVQGIADVLAVSLQSTDHGISWLAGHSTGGQCYVASVSPGRTAKPERSVNRVAEVNRDAGVKFSKINEDTTAGDNPNRIFRYAGTTLAELKQHLATGTPTGARIRLDQWRASIVCKPDELQTRRTMLENQLGVESARWPLAEQGLLWQGPSDSLATPKAAWIFPGQGSQYTRMLEGLVSSEPVAAKALAEANDVLRGMGDASFEEIAWGEQNSLGEDVWQTQASVLVANWILTQTLLDRGYSADLVTGHSYGEFSAMLAAGCWDLELALRATWHRCQSIVDHVPRGCTMLSVSAESRLVQSLIDRARLPLAVSHVNAPKQTVVGGKQTAIAELSQMLEEQGVTSRILPVPTAFHTPSLEPAKRPFVEAIASVPVAPPKIPLLSNISNSYVADPVQIRENLGRQLVEPLDFAGLVQRLIRDDVGIVVEVGPQQVLNRLIRQNSSDLIVVSLDHPKRSADFQLLLAQAQLEIAGVNPSATATVTRTLPESVAPVHFDATELRRNRLRSEGKRISPNFQPASVPAHFDATEARRGAKRQAARGEPLAPSAERRDVPIENVSQEKIARTETPTAAIEKFLIDFVVEQTGYPAEIIELDWDIEADLGIDSIKKAQLFGELREFFDLESHATLSLDEYHTLRDIVLLLEQTPGKGDWLRQSPTTNTVAREQADAGRIERNPAEEVDALGHASEVAQVAPDFSGADKGRAEELTAFLVDFVVEQTGYPPEIVELDADLEADLGIDSIKKAQLLGEIREMFALQVSASDGASPKQNEYSTLRSILEVLLASTADAPKQEGVVDGSDHSEVEDASAKPTKSLGFQELAQVSEVAKGTRPLGIESKSGFNPNSDLRKSKSTSVLPQASNLGSEFQPDEAYVEVAQSNIRMLSSRTQDQDFVEFASPSNGHANWYSDLAAEVARVIGADPRSVSAFDRAMQVQSPWQRLQTSLELLDASHRGSADSEIVWLAEMRLPAWLDEVATNNISLVRASDRSQIVVPGSTSSFATLKDGHLGVVVGLSKPNAMSGHAALELSQFVQSFKSAGMNQLARDARKLNERISEDWWLLALDSQNENMLSVSSESSCVLIESLRISEFDGRETTSSRRGFQFGFDCRSKNFLLQCPPNTSFSSPTRFEISQNGVSQVDLPVEEASTQGSQFSDTPMRCEDSDIGSRVTSRYELRLVESGGSIDRSRVNREPEFFGTTIVVGDNPVAEGICNKLRQQGVSCVQLIGSDDPECLAKQFLDLTNSGPVPHLFLTTPLDAEAGMSLDERRWRSRRNQALMGNFWLCQKWLGHVVDQELTDVASLVATTSLGGDFALNASPVSAEGGGLAGLLKSMIIESWTQGIRPLSIKIVESSAGQAPAQVVENVWQELAIPTYDTEVAYAAGKRQVIRAYEQPVKGPRRKVKNGGTWVCTGGARGITAYVAEQLGRRFDLKLHLIGKSPEPNVDPAWRTLGEAELRLLKAKVMTEARNAGQNPVKTWQNTEKAIEIDDTVARLRSMGLDVHYHSCDVSDRSAVREVLAKVRAISGPIHGVLHGAGVGKDSRFDRKQPDKVDECVAAKVDGSLSLMSATKDDPLEYFIGFGSISGRFGANGHTDYSLANEMLCKQIDWFAHQRPEVRAFGFHWHAWGDVGMATKPETRLALEMIDMQFMPAAEGMEHLINEMEAASGPSEVLITDDRYFRMFYPAETVVENQQTHNSVLADRPMLDCIVAPVCGGEQAFEATVDPVKDPFLAEHLLDGRPLLPFVVASEALYEAAAEVLQADQVVLRDIEATGGLRFYNDEPQQLRVETTRSEKDGLSVKLFSDFNSRAGKLVEANRLNFKATAAKKARHVADSRVRCEPARNALWTKAVYPSPDSKFYVGWALQRLRRFCLLEDGVVGKISAPALIELAGGGRSVAGWRIPSAAMDACLFTVGILAWQKVAPGSALPVRIGELVLGRLPAPGEACEVHARLNAVNADRASFDFSLYGVDDTLLLNALDYEVQWIQSGENARSNSKLERNSGR